MGISSNIKYTFLARCFNFVVMLTSSIIVARYLGPTGKGLYTLYFIISNMIMNFMELGLGDATIYV